MLHARVLHDRKTPFNKLIATRSSATEMSTSAVSSARKAPCMFPTSLRLASYNASSLTAPKLDFCVNLLVEEDIDILCVQETWWTEKVVREHPALFHHLPLRPRPVGKGSGKQAPKRGKHGLAVLIGARLRPFRSHIHIVHKDKASQASLTIRLGRIWITNVYLPPSMTLKEKWTSVLHAIPEVPSDEAHTVHVLLGDWNTGLGGLTGDTATNMRANGFNDIIQSRSLLVVPFLSPTATSTNTQSHASIIDFVPVSASHLNRCSAVTVLKKSGGSDHFPITVDLNCDDLFRTLDEEYIISNPRRIATHLLVKSSPIRQMYSDEVNTSLRDLVVKYRNDWNMILSKPRVKVSTVQGLLDKLTSSLISSLISSAEKHCKMRKRRTGTPKLAFPNDSVLANLREQRAILLKQLKMYAPVEEVRTAIRRDLGKVNREYDRRAKVLQKQKEKDLYDILGSKPLGEQQRMIKFLKNKCQRPGTKMLSHKRPPEYSKHFAKMFNPPSNFVKKAPITTSTTDDHKNTRLKIEKMPKFTDVSHFFSIPNMESFIRQASNGKAAGCSGVSAELLKPVASAVASVLSLVAEVMYRAGLCPDPFKQANIVPVPKKSNGNAIEDFRPISLTELPRRIIEKCLALLLAPFERNLSPMQGGFREHRSTLDQVAVLQQILSTRSKAPKNSEPTILAFLDIKSAYDSVDRELLWAYCKKAKIPDPVVRMLGSMFNHNESKVVIDGFEGVSFPNRVGLLQGSSLSPFLYALFIDDLPKALLSSKLPSIPLGGTKVNSILYADDIALVAESAGNMQGLLNCCTKFAKERHFKWGVQKCEILYPMSPLHHLH